MAGRPAKPHGLKVISGERKDRMNNAQPVPAAVAVEPPYKLTKDVAAVWDRLAPDLIAKGVLTSWDVDAFAMLCELIVLSRDGFRKTRIGVLVKGRNRNDPRVKNPALQAVRDITTQYASLAARFGMTPSDRQRLNLEPAENDPATRYLD